MRIILKIEIGTNTKKIVCHPKLSITYPPITRPTTDPEEKEQ
jgi:hypothetical protein